MEMNFLALLVAAVVPIIIGFLWYNPKVFGTTWMREAEMTEAKMKSGNMPLIFGLSLLFSFLLAFFMQMLVIHDVAAMGMVANNLDSETYKAFIAEHGGNFRTARHGFLHGIMASLFFVFPILAINAMFERKSWKYIFINFGYWAITIGIMGAIICAWK